MSEQVTIADYARRYVRTKDLSDNYTFYLVRRVELLEEWAGHPIPVTELTTDLVNRFLEHVKNTRTAGMAGYRKVMPATICGYRRSILTVWNAAADDSLCDYPRSRRVKRPKIKPIPPRAWNKAQVERLIEVAEQLLGSTRSGIPLRRYWPAMIRCAYDSGLRRGDLLRLRFEDITPDGIITIVQSKTNTPHTSRLRPSTLEAIQATTPPKREFIFNTGGHIRTWSILFKSIVVGSGLAGTFKYLRRTSGSLVEADNPGQGGKHLGHRSANMFRDHYEDQRLTRKVISQPPELNGHKAPDTGTEPSVSATKERPEQNGFGFVIDA